MAANIDSIAEWPAGAVLVAVINFLLIAFVVFLIVRSIEALRRKEEAVAPPDTQAQLAAAVTRLTDGLDRCQLRNQLGAVLFCMKNAVGADPWSKTVLVIQNCQSMNRKTPLDQVSDWLVISVPALAQQPVRPYRKWGGRSATTPLGGTACRPKPGTPVGRLRKPGTAARWGSTAQVPTP